MPICSIFCWWIIKMFSIFFFFSLVWQWNYKRQIKNSMFSLRGISPIFAFRLAKQSISCISDWRILGHVFKISLERPRQAMSGHHSACAVQEALFAPITDQRADKMSRIIIMVKFNKVKNRRSDSLCFQEFLIFRLLLHWNELLLH